MGTALPLTPILTAASTAFGVLQSMQQARYQNQVASMQAAQRRREYAAAEQAYQVQRQALDERTARDRRQSLLEFEREKRDRIRKLRLASGTAAADAAGRGVLAGGSAAAIQRGLERDSDTLAERAEEDQAEFQSNLAYDRALSAYELQRRRYLQLTGQNSAYQADLLARQNRRRINLLNTADQLARERLGIV